MNMSWHELALAVAQAEDASITLDGLVAEKLATNPRTRYTLTYEAARSAFPSGWGLVLDGSPGRDPYCDAIGPVRVGSTARSEARAVLAAACQAQGYVEAAERRRKAELAARAARLPQPAPGAVQFHEEGAEDGPASGTLTIVAPPA